MQSLRNVGKLEGKYNNVSNYRFLHTNHEYIVPRAMELSASHVKKTTLLLFIIMHSSNYYGPT